MIVSASYRTDIPAFYGAWFMRRLEAGYCLVENPYGGQPYRVSLLPEDVDGFIFWTKNLTPFINRLETIRARGFPFVVQYAINGYPRELEFSVVDAERSALHMHELAVTYGREAVVWRYDPVIFTSLTPVEFHQRNFAELAAALAGATDEVVISFAQIYHKTRRNLNWAASRFGFAWADPDDELKRELLAEFVTVAGAHGMRVSVCGQREYVSETVSDARCVDADRLAAVAGKPISADAKGHRDGCGCMGSRDIGAYDTCPHGCVYCYAVQRRDLAQHRFRAHDPASEYLHRSSQPDAELPPE